jgi:RimJ/RimL family protein N-acetyltransferase
VSDIRIETERLILRNIDPGRDFEAWAALMADERAVRFLGTPVQNRALAWRNMAMLLGHWQMRGYGFFWQRVIHVILSGNEPSIAVAKKLGSTYIRSARGLPGVTDEDVMIYGQIAD